MEEPPIDISLINRLVNLIEKTKDVDYCRSLRAVDAIIKRDGITVEYFSSAWMARKNGGKAFLGDNELIAAMRCYLGNVTPP